MTKLCDSQNIKKLYQTSLWTLFLSIKYASTKYLLDKYINMNKPLNLDRILKICIEKLLYYGWNNSDEYVFLIIEIKILSFVRIRDQGGFEALLQSIGLHCFH